MLASILLTIIIGCKENTQDAKITGTEEKEISADATVQTFENEMTGKVWDTYLELKTAFVKSDLTAVQSAASNIASILTEDTADLKNLAQQMADSDDLEKQRELFSEFTDKAGTMFKEALASGTMYKQFCPMAFNNTGAFWYSDTAEIRNPYFGDRMLKCGAVKETIKK